MVSREHDGPTLVGHWHAAVWNHARPTYEASSTVGSLPGRHRDAQMAS